MNGIHLYESKHKESYTMNVHHHSYYQLLYAIEGVGSIVIDGTELEFSRDYAALIVPYSDHAVSSAAHLTLLVLAFDDGSLQHAGWKPGFDHSALLRMNPLGGGELRLLLRKLLFEQRRSDSYSEWAMQIHLQEILLLLARARQSSAAGDANGVRAERIRSYIDSHYFEPLTVDDPARRLGIGARHATNIFKEQYGVTPMQYLAEVRMGIAKKLLAESDKDIVSICFEVGCESLPTFYRTFKNCVEMTPNQYRQRLQNAESK